MRNRNLSTSIAVYCGVLALTTFAFGSNWLRYQRFVENGTKTNGTVTETRCQHHMTFAYSFSLDGRTFQSSGNDGFGNPRCNELRVGDSINIWYLAQAPDQNTAGNPKGRRDNEAMTVFVGSLCCGLFIFAPHVWKKLSGPRQSAAVTT
jgi:hypothetical protein